MLLLNLELVPLSNSHGVGVFILKWNAVTAIATAPYLQNYGQSPKLHLQDYDQ